VTGKPLADRPLRVTTPILKYEALSYQVDAVCALEELNYGAVFHEQGLGKTKIAIDLALHWLATNTVDSVFIVTKRSLVPNWKREIERHTNLVPRVLSQDRKQNYFAFNSRARLYLLHYEVVTYEFERIELLQQTRRIGIILDESQKIKNPRAAISSAFHKLREGFVRRIIMTGTPVANRPYDVWSQVYFLDGGKALGKNFRTFREDFDLDPSLAYDPAAREFFAKRLEWLGLQLRPFSVRQTKASAGIDLPKKHIERIRCDLAPLQAQMYRAVREDLSLEVMRDETILNDSSEDILKRLLRLVQVASNPRLVDERYNEEPGKLFIVKALLNGILDGTEKAIVWTTFVENAKWLRDELSEYGTRCVHGNMAIDERERNIASFLEDESVQVLVATVGAAKEGLTLTAANHAIFFDRSFSLDDFLQAQDRIHRITQERTCYIYVLIARDTIDEWVDLLIDAKRFAAQLAQGDINLSEYRLNENYEFYEILKGVLSGGHPR
jgi:SNF2 family DNA or RNA helicase